MNPRIFPFRFSLLALGMFIGAGSAGAANTAFVFLTDGNDAPAVLTNAIKAREGADVVIVIIKPGTLPSINGVPVVDHGVVSLPRFDLAIPGAQARDYIVAGDFTLTADQSIWGWGSLALELEFPGDATFAAGSLINVSAIGGLGGPGGGNGGIPVPRTYSDVVFKDTKLGATYAVGIGGTRELGSTKGEDGQHVAAYQTAAAAFPLDIPIYASSLSGGGGTLGLAAQFFIPAQFSYTLPPVGGAGVASSAIAATGGAGGYAGQPGPSDVFTASAGFSGGPGGNGSPGATGVTGADGQVEAPGASNVHLRAGTGGGAGATGGTGLGAGTGGCGGGGGASGHASAGIYPVNAGGNGGSGGLGGSGGVGGMGGAGGGGGGALQIIVRGEFADAATFEAKGGEGGAGAAGGTGTAGGFGKAGVAGASGGSPNGGGGGIGGNGGKGGDGGHGGKGGSGSGGAIQITGSYNGGVNLVTDVSGGTGAPAGRFQVYDFQLNRTAPFGAFPAVPNPYRSYVADISHPIPPLPILPTADTPQFPGLFGGPAAYGRLLPEFDPTITDDILAKLTPPSNCDAVVFRLDPLEFQFYYPDYDFLVIADVRPGHASFQTRISAVSPADAATPTTLSAAPVLPTPQRTRHWVGWQYDPLIFPGRSGAEDYSVSYGYPWVTMVEKKKAFNVTLQYLPYNPLVTFTGTPVTGRLNYTPTPQGVIYINNYGRPRLNVEVAGGDYTENTLFGYAAEIASPLSTLRYVRLGSTPRVTMKVDNAIGAAWSLMNGTFQWTGAPYSDEEAEGDYINYSNVGKTDPPATLSVDVPTSTWYANQPAGIARGYLSPMIDSLPHQLTINVDGRVVSPVGATSGLGYGDTLTATSAAAGQTTPLTFQLSNTTTVPSDWAVDLSTRPKLTQLNVLSAQFIGDAGGAFSLANPLPLGVPLGGVQNMTVNFTPPSAGTYHATLRLTTDGGVATGQPGQTFDVALTGGTGDFTTYVSSLPVDLRGTTDDGNHNGVSNLLEYATGATSLAGLPSATPTGMQITLPAVARPDVFLSVEGSSDLAAWQTVATRDSATGAWTATPPATSATEQLLNQVRTAAVNVQGGLPRYFMRLNAALSPLNTYSNDFASDARATLLGSAALDSGSLRLTTNDGGLYGSAVLSGVQAWSGQTGFAADFSLIMGPYDVTPADGISFAVGDLGSDAFGESGPTSAHNLTIAFDTYGVDPPEPKGMRIIVNGVTIASSTVDPYTNGQTWPAEVTYTPTGGVSVKYNGNMIFTNVPVPTFTLQAGDKFGFGARTGLYSQESRVDDVVISPR